MTYYDQKADEVTTEACAGYDVNNCIEIPTSESGLEVVTYGKVECVDTWITVENDADAEALWFLGYEADDCSGESESCYYYTKADSGKCNKESKSKYTDMYCIGGKVAYLTYSDNKCETIVEATIFEPTYCAAEDKE